MSLSVAGLNLHKCCCRGLIMQYPWNWPSILQVIGRLFRIGGEKKVDWTILHVTGTMYDVAEDKMNRKFCEQLRLESQIPSFVKGLRMQRMIAYEIIRLTFGQPFNRFAWVMNPPEKVQDYDSKLNRVLGNIFSTIVSEVTNQPEDADSTSTEKMLDRLEPSIPKIAALVQRDPDNPLWPDIGVNRLMEMVDEMEVSEEDVSIGWPWWSDKAGISRGEWDNAAGTLFDLDDVVTDISTVINSTTTDQRRAAGEKALRELLGLHTDKRVYAPKKLRDMIRDMLNQPWCPVEAKEYLFKKCPELMDLVVADRKLFDSKQDGPSERTGSEEP